MITHALLADDYAVVVPELHERQGPTTSRKVRKVCRDHCNGGWMSQLETHAKPLLLPMIKNVGNSVFSVVDQEILSRWAVKTSIMMQFTDLSTKTSDRGDDTEFYKSSRALDLNRVWLGRYVGTQWDRRFFHANAVVGDRGTGRIADMWGTTTIAIDSLVVFVLWDAPGLLGPKFPYLPETVSIWPAVGQVEWPPTHSFTDDSLSEAARWVHRAASQHFAK